MKTADELDQATLRERIAAIVQRITDSNGTEIPTGVAESITERILREVQRG